MSESDKNEWLKKVIDEALNNVAEEKKKKSKMSELDMFKAVARSLVVSALKTLGEMEGLCEICGESPELMEKYDILYHNLDYLRRFCEGKV
ncbi:MAG: hypothetical protein ACE5IT_00835 [bacterium]